MFAEKEKIEQVVNEITFGSRDRIRVHLLGRKSVPFHLTFRVCQFEQVEQVYISLTSSNRISVSCVASTTRSLSATRTRLVGRTPASLISNENISCSRTSRCASRRESCKGSLPVTVVATVLHVVVAVPEVFEVLRLMRRLVFCLRGNTIDSFEPCVASWPVAL